MYTLSIAFEDIALRMLTLNPMKSHRVELCPHPLPPKKLTNLCMDSGTFAHCIYNFSHMSAP